MKKSIIIGLVITILSGFVLVPHGIAELNGFEEWLDPPIINVESPLNQTYSSVIPLNFTIESPDSWLVTPISFNYEKGSGLAQELISVTYAIDGKILESFSLNSNLSVPFNHFSNLSNLSVGQHELVIWTNATRVTRNWISSEVKSTPISSITPINFTVNQSVDITSPSPSVPEFSWLMIIPLLVAMLSVALVLRRRKTAIIQSRKFD